MRLARFSVEDPLAAIDARDRTVGRPDEFVREPHLLRVRRTRLPNRITIALDAFENFGRRRNVLLGQSVDALDDEIALLRRDDARDFAAIAITHDNFRGLRRVAAEAEAEPSVLNAYGFPVDGDLSSRADL